jgi:hypothetical protein
MINLKTTANSGRPLAGRSLLGLLSSAAMVLAFHGAASAADAPPVPNDALPITKAPPPATTPLPGHYKIGEIDLSVSGVATLGTAVRTTGRDAVLVPPQNGHAIGIPGKAVGGAMPMTEISTGIAEGPYPASQRRSSPSTRTTERRSASSCAG